ncbi:hypothetical protein BDV3_001786 [Batrachochytrium dendrobatidis]|nr:hypothetical protein QVD99_007094 [Batrachochytrium dendrobatidis]
MKQFKSRWIQTVLLPLLTTIASLLSSSCCVIQLVLNYLSLGCAGFAVFTPYRSLFTSTCAVLMAITIWLAGWSWRTLITFCISITLVVSQDLVSAHNDGRLSEWINQINSHWSSMIYSNYNPLNSVVSLTHHQDSNFDVPCQPILTLSFQIVGLKCEGCAGLVKNSISKLAYIHDVRVSFESKMVMVSYVAADNTDSTAVSRSVLEAISKVDLTYRAWLVKSEQTGCRDK